MNTFKLPVGIQPIHIKHDRIDIFKPQVTSYTPPAAQQKMNQAISDSLNKLMKDQGYGQPQTELTGGFDLKNNQKGVLSLTLTVYSYTGGAHGLTFTRGLTFNSLTGKQYTLGDLFKKNSPYKERINTLIKQQLQERGLTTDLLVPYPGITDTQSFYTADLTLVIIFDVYSLLPYVYGTIYFPISLYSLQDMINDEGPLGKIFS
ncbi:DUF3298 and DUF4163 domain-containing protein [Cytobacillus kochii]|uniref:DUF3298 and DUF4163 domain-containing protein n=1 Tax=Cytobacillus kochii TaxID=859143 RepID=UPI00384C9789